MKERGEEERTRKDGSEKEERGKVGEWREVIKDGDAKTEVGDRERLRG